MGEKLAGETSAVTGTSRFCSKASGPAGRLNAESCEELNGRNDRYPANAVKGNQVNVAGHYEVGIAAHGELQPLIVLRITTHLDTLRRLHESCLANQRCMKAISLFPQHVSIDLWTTEHVR